MNGEFETGRARFAHLQHRFTPTETIADANVRFIAASDGEILAEQSGRVFINHGGAGDELYESGYKLLVGILSPASDYLRGFVRLLSQLKLWRKRVAIVASKTSFARASRSARVAT